MQSDAVRGVDLCACSLRSHFGTQTTPHTARLMAALDSENEKIIKTLVSRLRVRVAGAIHAVVVDRLR